MPTLAPPALRLRTVTAAPGVSLHVLPSDRFSTTLCRVVLHRDLGAEATATSLLSSVLESATARHPSREALAHRLGDLYGAGLSVGVEKLGDRQLLSASLDWPTRGVPGRGASLSEGLRFLREVLTEPKRAGESLDPDIVATESRNLARSLRALKDDKGRYALRRCLEAACVGEPFALDPEGRLEDLPAATPAALAALHARLLFTAPVQIFLAGDLGVREARDAVRRHLLWPGRTRTQAPVPPVASVRAPRKKPVNLVERDAVSQGKLALAFRADVPPDSRLVPAAQVIAGVLGGTPTSRLFKVVRETHGLAYYAGAGWVRPKGMMLVQSGIEPKNEPRARRLILKLAREVAGGVLEKAAWEALREAVRHRLHAMQDDRGSAIGYAQEMTALGIDPRPERQLAALEAVKPADVRAVGKRLALDAAFFLTGLDGDGGGAGAAAPVAGSARGAS